MSKYNLDQETGDLSRAGEVIGNFNAETAELTMADAKFNNYKAPATTFLNNLLAEEPPAPPVQADEVTTGAEQAETEKAGDDASTAELDAIKEQQAESTATAAASDASDKEFAEATGCPAPPMRNPMYGDKTPNYVEWLFKYRRDVFDVKYGVTGMGQVPRINDETGEVTYEECIMSRRKTHLTEKVESQEDLHEGESWNA